MVIGDQEGVIQIFFIKNGELQVVFKSLPSFPITNVILGGSIGTMEAISQPDLLVTFSYRHYLYYRNCPGQSVHIEREFRARVNEERETILELRNPTSGANQKRVCEFLIPSDKRIDILLLSFCTASFGEMI